MKKHRQGTKPREVLSRMDNMNIAQRMPSSQELSTFIKI
jgi:hypothetical protein